MTWPKAEEVKACERMLAKGMQKMTVANLEKTHVGKKCVITAQTPSKRTPPPRGMVHVTTAPLMLDRRSMSLWPKTV